MRLWTNQRPGIFAGIDTGNLFEGLKRIQADPSANANNDLIEHAYRMGYLYDEKEYRFLKQTNSQESSRRHSFTGSKKSTGEY
ncbi:MULTISPECIES: hypothetical protein [Rhizobium]|uniref:Uncharacterized protein n=2 Tax=Rhizobium TaxID=379 RepID=A0A0B4XAB8_9HYPH|nr:MULTISPECIES: hypothetical protein [Rhizobium]AJD43720.1 hypothetical protein RGR602_PB00182 [Rhizobium gallicum bv. gallicum R602sp]MBB4276546.1 hypothetical protein [Rhizobium mongolense]TDW34201.1 hypothetical protein EV128_104208 [Rhizobium azibense]